MIAIRVDALSRHELFAFDDRREIDPAKNTWRGLKIVVEYPPPPLKAITPDVIPDDTVDFVRIITIEARDERSSRTIYLNDPNNPEGFK